MATPLNTLKNWFKTGLKPTQSQFWASWESFWHKDEKIPQASIDGLQERFDEKADAEAVDGINLSLSLKSDIAATGNRLSSNPAGSKISLLDANGEVLDTLDVGFLNNEGTVLSYNSLDLTIELINDAGDVLSTIPISSFLTNIASNLFLSGATLQLRDSANTVLSNVILDIANIEGLLTALGLKVDKEQGSRLINADEIEVVSKAIVIEKMAQTITGSLKVTNSIESDTSVIVKSPNVAESTLSPGYLYLKGNYANFSLYSGSGQGFHVSVDDQPTVFFKKGLPVKNERTFGVAGRAYYANGLTMLIPLLEDADLVPKRYVDDKFTELIKTHKKIPGATYTLLEADKNFILIFTNSKGCTVTVPTGLTLGNRYEGKQHGNGSIFFVGAATVSIRHTDRYLPNTYGKYAVFALDSITSLNYDLYGELQTVYPAPM